MYFFFLENPTKVIKQYNYFISPASRTLKFIINFLIKCVIIVEVD